MIGERVGLLIVSDFYESRGAQDVWTCTCECGGVALRTTRSLLVARRRGSESCCSRCAEELRRGSWQQRQDQGRAIFRELWDRTSRLYGLGFDDREIAVLREALVDEQLGWLEPEPDHTSLFVADPAEFITSPGQRAMAMFPIVAGPWRRFQCERCGLFFQRGLGCGFCLRPVCRTCVREEQHRCGPEVPFESFESCAALSPGGLVPARKRPDCQWAPDTWSCLRCPSRLEPDWMSPYRVGQVLSQRLVVRRNARGIKFVRTGPNRFVPLG